MSGVGGEQERQAECWEPPGTQLLAVLAVVASPAPTLLGAVRGVLLEAPCFETGSCPPLPHMSLSP